MPSQSAQLNVLRNSMSNHVIVTLEKEGEVGFADYSAGEKPCGFCVSYTGAFFYEGLRVRCARESIAGINCIVARHNRYTFYDVCAFFKPWRGLNENY